MLDVLSRGNDPNKYSISDSRGNLSSICSVYSFSYKELVVAYGPGFQNLVRYTLMF